MEKNKINENLKNNYYNALKINFKESVYKRITLDTMLQNKDYLKTQKDTKKALQTITNNVKITYEHAQNTTKKCCDVSKFNFIQFENALKHLTQTIFDEISKDIDQVKKMQALNIILNDFITQTKITSNKTFDFKFNIMNIVKNYILRVVAIYNKDNKINI